MSPKYVPVTEFRGRVLESVRRAQNSGQEYIITARGKPAAVLLGFDEWESLLETLEIKNDKTLITQIQKNQRYFKKGGKGKSHQDINWD